MNKDLALALAPIIVNGLREHAQQTLANLNDEQKAAMHPEGLAALETLSNIQGDFCKVAPDIVSGIDRAGFFIRMFLGQFYAYLQVLRQIVVQMQTVLCKTQ